MQRIVRFGMFGVVAGALVAVGCGAQAASAQQPSDRDGRAAAPPELTEATEAAPPAVPAIDANALAIYEGGIARVRGLRSLELVVETKLVDPDGKDVDPATWGAKLAPGFGGPFRVRLAFPQATDHPGIGRLRLERLADGGAAPVAGTADGVRELYVTDGVGALLVDHDAKTYASSEQWMDLAGPAYFVGMPWWIVQKRLPELEAAGGRAGSLFGGVTGGALPADAVVSGATLVGTETIDGVACDVIRILRTVGAGDGAMLQETVAFAKSDGLPRKIAIDVVRADAPAGVLRRPVVVHRYHGVRADPAFEEATFALGAPEGFRKVDAPALLGARAQADGAAGAPDAPPRDGQPGVRGMGVAAGDRLPDFALERADGGIVTPATIGGKVAVIVFFASWCVPSQASLPVVQKLAEEYAGTEVVIAAVGVLEKDPAASAAYVKSRRFTFEVLAGGDAFADRIGLAALPTVVVVGRDGRVAWTGFGLLEPVATEVRDAIDAALGRR